LDALGPLSLTRPRATHHLVEVLQGQEQAAGQVRGVVRVPEQLEAFAPLRQCLDLFPGARLVGRCRRRVVLRHYLELLRPDPDNYFVLKPKHSSFFSTALDTLLEYLGTRAVILTGMAANICVLFTANDAYMRDLRLAVLSDCVASNTEEENRHGLDQMRKVLKADTLPSTELSFHALARREG